MEGKRGENTCGNPGELIEKRMKKEIREGHLEEEIKK